MADVCVFRLIENGRVAITAVVHVDDILAVCMYLYVCMVITYTVAEYGSTG